MSIDRIFHGKIPEGLEGEAKKPFMAGKPSPLRKAAYVGMMILSLGIGSMFYTPPTVHAAEGVGVVNNKENPGSYMQSEGVVYDTKTGKMVTQMQGYSGVGPDGTIFYGGSQGDDEDEPEYNTAQEYIKRAEEQMRTKASLRDTINTLETGLKIAKGDIKVQIHHALSTQYRLFGDDETSLKHLYKVKELDPEYEHIDWSIAQKENKIKSLKK